MYLETFAAGLIVACTDEVESAGSDETAPALSPKSTSAIGNDFDRLCGD